MWRTSAFVNAAVLVVPPRSPVRTLSRLRWLYFDAVRPQPMRGGTVVGWSGCGHGDVFPADCTFALAEPPDAVSCPAMNRWKDGTGDWPATLGRSATQARAHCAVAEIHYLEGALDSGTGRGTAATILDKSCAAMAQSDFRLQRGVACVFASPAALLGLPR